MDGGLDAAERALVERIADRREEIVALTRELIGFDTTSRAGIDQPAREEAALQQALADRLRAAGAEIDLWEPAPEDVTDHPLSVPGIAFDGRPQLAATLRGTRRWRVRCCSTGTSTSSPPGARRAGRPTRSTPRWSTGTSSAAARAT